MAITTDLRLLRLLQLSSAALPVGAFAFSQGMETAVELGWIHDRRSTGDWLALQVSESHGRVDLPLLRRCLEAVNTGDEAALALWNHTALACRETSELRLADTATGAALRRLLNDLSAWADTLAHDELSFVTAFAVACGQWDIESDLACQGFCWSWLENQVAAATKLVPLGQTDAQRLLGELLPTVPEAITFSVGVADDEIGASLPALAMASSWHETQYTRLFRS